MIEFRLINPDMQNAKERYNYCLIKNNRFFYFCEDLNELDESWLDGNTFSHDLKEEYKEVYSLIGEVENENFKESFKIAYPEYFI